MDAIRRLLQESSGLSPWVGLAESSFATEWAPGDCGNGPSAVGEADREWALPSRMVREPCRRQSLGVSGLGWRAWNPSPECFFAVFRKGMVSLLAFHAVSHEGFLFWLT